ncbi:MAG: pilus assembly protein PilM [Betaproteobacteria bacterium]
MSAIAAQVRDLARRLGLAGFGRWWAQELWSFVPAGVKDSIERRRARPVLVFDGNVATLWHPKVNGRLRLVESAKIALDAGETSVVAAGRTALASVARPGSPDAEVIVALPPRAALRKTLTLPAAIEDDLRPALAYDLDRHTPFRADEIYFDAAVVDRDASRNALIVDLVAVRRSLVDPMLRHAENFGARVVAVVAEPPERAAASRVNLLPDERRTETLTWTRWRVVVPAALLALLALAAMILPLWQKRQEAIALIRVSEAARYRAEASEALRSELERKVGDYNFALQRKYAYPGTVQVLDDVTRILPDDTWLTQFEFHTGRAKDATRDIVLRGESANAGRLVALLQDSRLFTQAAPRSPTTKIQPGPGEIFDVGAQVVSAHAPEPRPLDVTAPPPAPVRRAPTPPAVRPAVQTPGAPAGAAAPGPQTAPGKTGASAPAAAPATGTPAQPAAPSGQPVPQAAPAQAPAVRPATPAAQAPGPAQPPAQTMQPPAQPELPAAQAPQRVPAPVAPQPAPQPVPQGQPQLGPLPPGAGGNVQPEPR